MTAYYNEIDPYAAQWPRNLIVAGHIAPGDVDERSVGGRPNQRTSRACGVAGPPRKRTTCESGEGIVIGILVFTAWAFAVGYTTYVALEICRDD